MRFNDPRWADTSNAIASAIIGPDPRQRAQSEAYLGSASRDYAAADLDRQTGDYREQLVQAILNPNTRAAMAYAAGAGGQYATGATPLIAGQAALPGADVSPEIASNISAVMGVQRMGDTPVGYDLGLANEIRKQQISSGASLAGVKYAADKRAASDGANRNWTAPGFMASQLERALSPDSDGGTAITPAEQAVIDNVREGLRYFGATPGAYGELAPEVRPDAAAVDLGLAESADNAADNDAAAARAAEAATLDRLLAEMEDSRIRDIAGQNNAAKIELEQLRQSGAGSDPASLAAVDRALDRFLSGFDDAKVDPRLRAQASAYYHSRMQEPGATVGQVLGEIEQAITGTGKKEGFFGDDAPFRFTPPAGGSAPAGGAGLPPGFVIR